jgi:hypothetical protein
MAELVLILIWIFLVAFGDFKRDVIFAVMSFIAAGITMNDATLSALSLPGVEAFTMPHAMMVVSLYVLLRTAITVKE